MKNFKKCVVVFLRKKETKSSPNSKILTVLLRVFSLKFISSPTISIANVT